VSIARAIITKPSIILADEPTGNLDSKTGEEILKIFGQIIHDGGTILLVTHDPKVAQRGSRIIAILDGEIVEEEMGEKNGN
jgi:putative ABC transport system ATP-binding protein